MKKQILGTAGVLTAGLLIGSAFSLTSAANAADENATSVTTTTSTSTDATTPTFTPGDGDRPDVFSAESVKPGESLVTGDSLTKLSDAALAKFPGATIIRVENDSDGDEYEVHLKKADGSVVTVTFDQNFVVTGDHEGFADPAKGGPAGGPRGGHGPHDADDNDGGGPAGGGFTAPSTGVTTN